MARRRVGASAWYWTGLAVGVLVAALSGSLDVALREAPQGDISYIWAGPRAILAGYDAYDPVEWRRAVDALGTQPFEGPAVYSYPPPVAVLLLPLALLPLHAAVLAWWAAGIVTAMLGMRALLAEVVPDRAAIHGMIGMCLVLSHPAIATMRTGQWTFLLLGTLALAVVGIHRGRPLASATVSGLLLAKPQLAIVTVPGLVAWAAPAIRRRYAFATALLAAVPTAATVAFRPGWWSAWIREIPLTRATEPNVATGWRVLGDAFGPVGQLALAALGGAAVLWTLRSRPGPWSMPAVLIAASLALAPYQRSADHLLILVPLVLAAGDIAPRWPRAADTVVVAAGLVYLAGGWVLILVVAEMRRSESIYWLLSLGILVLALAVALSAGRSALGRTPSRWTTPSPPPGSPRP